MPSATLRCFDRVAVSCSIGMQAPGSGTAISLDGKTNRAFAGLAQFPAFAAGSRLVQFVLAVVERCVHQQRPVLARVEPEALDRSYAAFFEQRVLAPGLAAVRGEQEEWIARSTLQVGAGDPAGLKIDELDLIQPRSTHPG